MTVNFALSRSLTPTRGDKPGPVRSPVERHRDPFDVSSLPWRAAAMGERTSERQGARGQRHNAASRISYESHSCATGSPGGATKCLSPTYPLHEWGHRGPRGHLRHIEPCSVRSRPSRADSCARSVPCRRLHLARWETSRPTGCRCGTTRTGPHQTASRTMRSEHLTDISHHCSRSFQVCCVPLCPSHCH